MRRFPGTFTAAEYVMLGFVLLYMVTGFSLAMIAGVPNRFRFFLYGNVGSSVSVIIAGFALAGRASWVLLKFRPEHPIAFVYQDFRNLISRDRLLRALPVFICVTLFLSAFTSMKSLIPVFNPFQWDSFFAELDRGLHGGVDPWRIIHASIGFPLITYVINFGYNLWFLLMFAMMYWQMFSFRNPLLRMQFFYSYFLAWGLNGTLLAMIFSSAGPCFYGYVAEGTNVFEPLMSYLHRADGHYPVWALNTQNELWSQYQSASTGMASGISAMPSMHVSIALVLFLIGLRTNRWMAIGFGLYFALILVGSVHLAWHYAVDGYLSILTTLCIWAFSGWLLRKPFFGLRSSAPGADQSDTGQTNQAANHRE